MTDTSVTYERTMNVTYPRADGRLSTKLMKKLQRALALMGIYMVGNYSDKPEFENYNEKESSTTERTFKLRDENEELIHDFGVVDYSAERRGMRAMLRHLRDQFWDTMGDVTLDEAKVVTTSKSFPKWKGNNVIANDMIEGPSGGYLNWIMSYVEGHYVNFFDAEDPLDSTKMRVKLDPSRSDGDARLAFTIWRTADKTQKKSDIEEWLVSTPLDSMAWIQARIEECLEEVGFDTSAPVIDCHFDAKTESRSECAPDIIGRLREAKIAARD